MTELFNNNISTTLAASVNTSQTTITITSATGWPSLSSGQFYRAVITSSASPGTIYEYLQVTNIAGTTLTVARGQENSTAQNWNSGDIIYMTATAASFATFATAISSGVTSFNTRTGAVSLLSADVTGALGFSPANIASPAFTGVPTAPTAATGTNTAQLATCAFVLANAGGGGSSGVSSFNSRTGAVTLQGTDVTSALGYSPANINGTNATGTWPISISGNAATATSANTANTANTANNANAATTAANCTGNAATVTNGVYLSNFTNSLASSGYQVLPGGLIMQWGNIPPQSRGSSTSGSYSVTFPTSFTSGVFSIAIALTVPNGGAASYCSYSWSSNPGDTTTSGTIFYWDNTQLSSNTFGASWIAFGR
jgi:hypothetical protein